MHFCDTHLHFCQAPLTTCAHLRYPSLQRFVEEGRCAWPALTSPGFRFCSSSITSLSPSGFSKLIFGSDALPRHAACKANQGPLDWPFRSSSIIVSSSTSHAGTAASMCSEIPWSFELLRASHHREIDHGLLVAGSHLCQRLCNCRSDSLVGL